MLVRNTDVLTMAHDNHVEFEDLTLRYAREKAEMESYIQKANELVREAGEVMNQIMTAETRLDADEYVARSQSIMETAAGYRSDAMSNYSEMVTLRAQIDSITGAY